MSMAHTNARTHTRTHTHTHAHTHTQLTSSRRNQQRTYWTWHQTVSNSVRYRGSPNFYFCIRDLKKIPHTKLKILILTRPAPPHIWPNLPHPTPAALPHCHSYFKWMLVSMRSRPSLLCIKLRRKCLTIYILVHVNLCWNQNKFRGSTMLSCICSYTVTIKKLTGVRTKCATFSSSVPRQIKVLCKN